MANEKVDKKLDEMLAVDITSFIEGTSLPISIYLKLADDKFVKVARAGELVPVEQFQKYIKNDIHYVYVDRDMYTHLVDKNIIIANFLLKSGDLNNKTKSGILQKMTQSVFTEIMEMNFSTMTYQHSKQIVEATVTLVSGRSDLDTVMELLSQSSDELVTHAVGTSMFACMIAKALDWTHPQTLEKLALGAMLHDIGKKELPKELLKKSRAEMTFEEIQLYESHPFRGMRILQSLKNIPEEVIAIVYQHHELSGGQGYPQHLKDLKIHPMAKVVGLANTLAELCIGHPNTGESKSPRQAIDYIENVMGQPFNKQIFKCLVNMAYPPENKKKKIG